MHKETYSNVPFPDFFALAITFTLTMQLMRLAFFAALLASAARADHHTCGWTGPGPGNPTKYGFVQWCITEQAIEHDLAEAGSLESRHHHTHVPYDRRPHGHDDGPISYYCMEADKNETKIGDWDKLRTNILEIGTPCNDGGFGGDSCGSDNWGFCWSESGNLDNISPRGCFYITKYDDCEWPGEVKEDDLPKHIVVVVK